MKRAAKEGGYSEPEDVIARGRPPAMTTARLRELVQEADRAGEEGDVDFNIESLLKELHGNKAKSR